MKFEKRLAGFVLALLMVMQLLPLTAIVSNATFNGTFQFDENGKFTVMQVADIQDNQDVDSRVISVLTQSIARYSPDLVVFTGDNVIESILTQSYFRSSVDDFLAPLLSTNTKFAVTFGNHDDQGPGAPDKSDQYAYYLSAGGNNFVDHDVASLDGVGSGVIPIYPHGQSSGSPAWQVYLMDSGSNPSSGSYDGCYTSQIDYYCQRSQQYPDVPSLWFQHVIVPDIYTRGMTTSGSGTGFKGAGSFSGNTWYLDPARVNWARSSSSAASDVYNEAPAACTTTLYQSAAHRSSAAYGNKTLYEAWRDFGNMKGAYFGHDHVNEFTCTTSDGIDLGYGECTGLYKTVGVISYNDDNPGVSIYELSVDGSYTNRYAAESDLSVPVVDPAAATGSWRFYCATTPNGTEYGTDNGTYDNVYIRFYAGANATGALLYQSPDLGNGKTNGGNSGSINATGVPTTKNIASIQVILPIGTDQWGCAQVCVYYTPSGGSEQLIWNYDPNETSFDEGDFVNYNTAWFQNNNHTVAFDGNGATGGAMTPQDYVWGTAGPLKPNAFQKTGYTFTGWAESAAGSVAYQNTGSFTMGTVNRTLYARWTPNTYTVVYDGNGATGGVTAPSQYTYGIPGTLRPNGFVNGSRLFKGWATSADGVVFFADGQNILNLETSGSVTLFAVWSSSPVLEAKMDSTTVVDQTNKLIFGLEPGMNRADFESLFIQVNGDGSIGYTAAGNILGTGTQINLIDTSTGEVAAVFTIVIFGDVNGDGNIDSSDAGSIVDMENFITQWDPMSDAALFRAGDVNGDGNVDSSDGGLLIDCENFMVNVDQVTGIASG